MRVGAGKVGRPTHETGRVHIRRESDLELMSLTSPLTIGCSSWQRKLIARCAASITAECVAVQAWPRLFD